MIGILVLGVALSQMCARFKIPIASWVMDNFERKEFRKTFPGKGPIFFMLGSIFVVYLFPLKIALAAMMILSIGDALSHIFGKLLSGKTYKYLKSVEGTLIGMVFSFFGALIFVDASAALIGTSLALGFESINIEIEDNLFVPIIAAIVMAAIV